MVTQLKTALSEANNFSTAFESQNAANMADSCLKALQITTKNPSHMFWRWRQQTGESLAAPYIYGYKYICLYLTAIWQDLLDGPDKKAANASRPVSVADGRVAGLEVKILAWFRKISKQETMGRRKQHYPRKSSADSEGEEGTATNTY